MVRFSGAGCSDVGLVRSNNEDAAFVGSSLALVADGVGGAAAGELASATAAHAMVGAALRGPLGGPEDALRAGAESARAAIQRVIQSDLQRLGMATTLTAVLCDGTSAALAHVGDSRAYRLAGRGLEPLTADHTYVQRLVSAGQLAPEAVARHPWRNVVLRSLDGDPGGLGVDVVPLALRVGDRLLLCSDGLTDFVPEGRVVELLGLEDRWSAARALTQAALGAGGRDNITCVVLDVVDGLPERDEGRFLGAAHDLAEQIDPAVRQSA